MWMCSSRMLLPLKAVTACLTTCFYFNSKGPPGIKGEKGDTGSPGVQVMADTILFNYLKKLPIFSIN